MRRTAPVCQVDPGGMWAVSRYDDVMHVLKHPELFSSRGFGETTNPPWLGGNPFSESMIAMDPPQHGRLRGSSAGRSAPPPWPGWSRACALSEQIVAGLPLDSPWTSCRPMPCASRPASSET